MFESILTYIIIGYGLWVGIRTINGRLPSMTEIMFLGALVLLVNSGTLFGSNSNAENNSSIVPINGSNISVDNAINISTATNANFNNITKVISETVSIMGQMGQWISWLVPAFILLALIGFVGGILNFIIHLVRGDGETSYVERHSDPHPAFTPSSIEELQNTPVSIHESSSGLENETNIHEAQAHASLPDKPVVVKKKKERILRLGWSSK